MNYQKLGSSGLNVSRLAFGCLCMGFLQHHLTPEDGGELIMYAMEKGINLFDTAQFYRTYGHIRHAVKNGYGEKMILCTKSYAYDQKGAEKALREALDETGKDTADLFLLHETESVHTIRGHKEALDYYIKMKQKGYIKAVGVSTHHIAAVNAAAQMSEIDVIEPLINKNGLGIVDGSREDMEQAIAKAHRSGKGIIAMKALGGGNLYKEAKDCFKYIDNLYGITSILCGMISKEEIDCNTAYFENRIDNNAFELLGKKQKKLLIEDWCSGCGNCVTRCPNQALRLINHKAYVTAEKCLTCGYCSGGCKEMAIKIIGKETHC